MCNTLDERNWFINIAVILIILDMIILELITIEVP